MKLLKDFDYKNNYCKIQMSSWTEVHSIQVSSKSWFSRIKQNIKDLAWLICYFGQVSGLLLRSLKIKCNFSKKWWLKHELCHNFKWLYWVMCLGPVLVYISFFLNRQASKFKFNFLHCIVCCHSESWSSCNILLE